MMADERLQAVLAQGYAVIGYLVIGGRTVSLQYVDRDGFMGWINFTEAWRL
jgi:hypothetical protein